MDIVLLVLMVVLLFGVIVFSIHRELERRKNAALDVELLEALELLGRALRSGHGVAAGLQIVGTQRRGRIAQEFLRAWNDQNAGLRLDQAFSAICQRVPSRELKLVALAIAINYEYGGNLADVLGRLAQALRARRELAEDVLSLTKQGRLTAWFAAAFPFAIGIAVTAISPDYLEPLRTNPIGRAFTALAIGMIAVGTLFIRMLASFEV